MRKAVSLGVACITLLCSAVSEAACTKDAWTAFVSELVAGQSAFVRGNPAPILQLWSHADDVTLMGAWGGHERGWSLVGPRLEWVSKQSTEGTYSYSEISTILGTDLASFVQIERFAIPNIDGGAPASLRVSHVMRCEGDKWKIVSRHADRLMETKPPPGVKPRG
jgi:hypothetical protein